MGFLSDIFNRAGRVARGQASDGMSAVEDATFDATVRQTVATCGRMLLTTPRAWVSRAE